MRLAVPLLALLLIAPPPRAGQAQQPISPPPTIASDIACIMPEPRSLLPEGQFDQLQVRVLAMGQGQPRTLYVGTSWMPSNGRIFAVSCAGKPLEEEETGTIRAMQAGPVLPFAGRTLLVVATTD